MTSKLHHRDDDISTPIHFFKSMLPKTLLKGKLRIPQKFARRYGKCLPNTMFLKLPNGTKWEVDLEKHDGRVWLCKGWKEFAEYHSLAHGHLLIFKYNRTSHFDVIIFDLTSVEINYPSNKVYSKRARSSEFQPPKKQRTNENNTDESNPNLESCKGMLKNPSKEKRNNNDQKHTKRSPIRSCGAHAATSDMITSFKVILKSYNSKWSLNIPIGTLEDYIKKDGQNVMLLVGDRSWKVKVLHYKHRSNTWFSRGWSVFVKENDLERGDTCFFKLVSTNGELVMKVTISKWWHLKWKSH